MDRGDAESEREREQLGSEASDTETSSLIDLSGIIEHRRARSCLAASKGLIFELEAPGRR